MTKEKFEAYRKLQESGKTNMLDVISVWVYSRGALTKDEVQDIIWNYEKYLEQWPEINWEATPEDRNRIYVIAQRASDLASQYGVDYPQSAAMMDITATHCNGMPLRLQELLEADDGNFAHDVFGIRRHLDRETGKLKDCFLPRCARS